MMRLPPTLILGALITLFFAALAVLSLVWTPYDIASLSVSNRFQPWSGAHLLGTDQFGRDIASMLMEGTRTSIAVALVAIGIGVALGVPLGLAAAALRGSLLDEVIMRGNDMIFAFPSLVIAILITAIWGPSATNAILAIGIFNIPVFAVSRAAAHCRSGLWTISLRPARRASRARGSVPSMSFPTSPTC